MVVDWDRSELCETYKLSESIQRMINGEATAMSYGSRTWSPCLSPQLELCSFPWGQAWASHLLPLFCLDLRSTQTRWLVHWHAVNSWYDQQPLVITVWTENVFFLHYSEKYCGKHRLMPKMQVFPQRLPRCGPSAEPDLILKPTGEVPRKYGGNSANVPRRLLFLRNLHNYERNT